METEFIKCALDDFTAMWSANHIKSLAKYDVPHNVLGRRLSLLKGDINGQWARWFAESLTDPRRVAEQEISYAFLFEEVLGVVEHRFHTTKTKSEKKHMASVVAKIIQNLSRSIAATRDRHSIPLEKRHLLLDISGSPPHCWICGAPFNETAIEIFLSAQRNKIVLPPFVDVLKPRGLVERDFAIEVDHVVPFSEGGGEGDNLKLTCGWCNRNKSANMSIYGVEGQPRPAGPNELGLTSLPQPFWIIRLLALVRKCEHPDGCDRSVDNAEMTVVPIRERGALNPTNLRVTCYDHDPFVIKRRQPPNIVRRIWCQ